MSRLRIVNDEMELFIDSDYIFCDRLDCVVFVKAEEIIDGLEGIEFNKVYVDDIQVNYKQQGFVFKEVDYTVEFID